MYATHRLKVRHPYTIYGMPMLKKVTGWTQICSYTRTEAFRKDKRKDRQSDSFVHREGGYKSPFPTVFQQISAFSINELVYKHGTIILAAIT